MAGAIMGQFQPHAACNMGATTVVSQTGCSVVKTTTGVYTITLSQPLDATEGIFLVTLNLVTIGTATVIHTSDTVKVVYTWNATVAADEPFSFFCAKIITGTNN